MWQCRGQRKQWTRFPASGSHQRPSWSVEASSRMASSAIGLHPRGEYTLLVCDRSDLDSRVALRPPPNRGPVYETAQPVSIFPGQPEKLRRRHVVCLFAQKRFESPPQVRALPWLEAVAPCDNPIVVQRSKHLYSSEKISFFRS